MSSAVKVVEFESQEQLVKYIDRFAEQAGLEDHRNAFEMLDRGELEDSFAALELRDLRHLLEVRFSNGNGHR
ncbi:MAG: hypothetical protein AAF605_08330 [Myxococcota bacterium]